jgi:predicted regulator of Ras-like GTPase activity (Roadblock/LC7/MglB family)
MVATGCRRARTKEGPVTKAEAMAAALNEFLDVSWEVEAAAVVSPDGLPMASALPPEVEEDRLAAMSASLLTLGERAAHTLNRGELSQVLVEGERGYVLLMAAGPSAVLVAVTSHDAKVGLVLFEMRNAVESIAAVMDGSYRKGAAAEAAETEIVVDPAALGETDLTSTRPVETGPPPAPPERVWESGSREWQSGAAPQETESGLPVSSETQSGRVPEPADVLAADQVGATGFSVPGGAAEADPAAWEPATPASGDASAAQEGAPSETPGEPAGVRHWGSHNRPQDATEQSSGGPEPSETESAPSWR